MKVNKYHTIRDVLEMDREKTTPVFLSFGMHCLFCPCSTMETLEEASFVHGADVDQLVEKLNAALEESA